MTSRPLRVCFVAGNIYPLLSDRGDASIVGGAEIQQVLIAGELARRGIDVVFVGEDFGQGPDVVAGGFRVLGYPFSSDKLRQGRGIWRALQAAAADIYYMRGAPRFLGLLLAFCLSRRVPLVLGLSSNQMAHAGRKTGYGWPNQLLYRWTLSRCGAVVAQTGHQRELLVKNYGLGNVVVIPNATRPSAAAADPARSRTVVWLGSVLPYKGIETVFDLAGRLPSLTFEIVAAPGRGADDYHDAMRAQAAELKNVAWRGRVPNAEIDSVVAGALAVINTTLTWKGVPNIEGFPNVYLEAWRNGVPTVTLDNDPDEVICRHGLGFHSRTVGAMAKDLERLEREPELRTRQGSETRAYVERAHSLDHVAGAYRDLLMSIVSRS